MVARCNLNQRGLRQWTRSLEDSVEIGLANLVYITQYHTGIFPTLLLFALASTSSVFNLRHGGCARQPVSIATVIHNSK